MAFQVSNKPSRWAEYCPGDGFDYCAAISPNDFVIDWEVSSFGDTLTAVSVSPAPNGLVSSITTNPAGQVEKISTGTTVVMNWDAGDGRWEPASEFGVEDDEFYEFTVSLNVTLTTGDSCSYNITSQFLYNDLGSLPSAAPTVTGVQQVGEVLTGADNYSDSDSDPQDIGNTVRRWYSYTDAAGSLNETLLGTGDTYTLTASEDEKYIRYKVIPAASSGPSPGPEAQSAVFGPIVTNVAAWTFTNDNPGIISLTQSFNTITPVGIDWGDGSGLEVTEALSGANAFNHTYSSSASKTVSIYCDPSEITALTCTNEQVLSVDLTNLDQVADVGFPVNSGLTSLTLPVANTATWTNLNLNQTGLTGTFDMSSLPNMPTSFQIWNSVSVTEIITPASGSCTDWRSESCGLTGTLDLSNIDISNQFRCHSIASLTGITFGTSTGNTSLFQTFNTGITSLDLSMFTFTNSIALSNSLTSLTLPSSGQTATSISTNNNSFATLDISGFGSFTFLNSSNNFTLTTLTLPSTSGTITSLRLNNTLLGYTDFTNMTFSTAVDIRLQNCGMTAAEVNCILADLDSVLPGSGTGSVQIHLSNAAPDGSSGGCDGTTAAANIAAKGYTVTTS